MPGKNIAIKLIEADSPTYLLLNNSTKKAIHELCGWIEYRPAYYHGETK
jgi:hypothetical protein